VVGSVLVAAAAALWGLWPLWIRHGPNGPAVAAIAFLTGGLVGAPLALRAGRGRRRRARDWGLLALLGVADAANAWCYFRALAEGAVAPGVLAHYLAPVLVALAAPALLGEPRGRRTPLALALALVGTAALVLSVPDGGAGAAATRQALLFGGVSAIFYCATVLLSKQLGAAFADLELLSWHVLVAGALLLAGAGPLGPPAGLGSAVAGGLVSTLVAGVLYYAGLRRVPAERAAILAYLEPLVAVLVGWAAFGEIPAPVAAAGGALIVAGGALVVARARLGP
jgi:drug/metabolite transporter (DMT)-like permease